MPRTVALASALVLAAACRAGGPAPLTDQQRTAITDSVRQMAAGLAAEVTAHGYRGFPPTMDSAPGYLWAYNGFIPFPSFDAMAAWTRSESEASTREVFVWDTMRVQAIAPGIATFAAGFSETRPDGSGRPKTQRSVFTALALHREGGWKFTNAHTSTLPPPAPPPPPTRRR